MLLKKLIGSITIFIGYIHRTKSTITFTVQVHFTIYHFILQNTLSQLISSKISMSNKSASKCMYQNRIFTFLSRHACFYIVSPRIDHMCKRNKQFVILFSKDTCFRMLCTRIYVKFLSYQESSETLPTSFS